MGNIVTNITRGEFARSKPWLFDEHVTVGKEQTPIVFFVVKAGLISTFNVFIRRGFNFNIVDEFGNTPLHYAAIKSGLFVSTLIDVGLDPCYRNKKGQTPLILAVLNKKIEHVKLLRSSIFTRDEHCNGPIHHAMRLEDTNMVKELVKHTPDLPKHWLLTYNEPIDYHLNYFANDQMFPPMHLSVIKMNKDLARCILSLGGDVGSEYNGKSSKSILARIGSSMLYGGNIPTERCTREQVVEMWSILTDDTNVYRHIDATASRETGLLSGEYKCF